MADILVTVIMAGIAAGLILNNHPLLAGGCLVGGSGCFFMGGVDNRLKYKHIYYGVKPNQLNKEGGRKA